MSNSDHKSTKHSPEGKAGSTKDALHYCSEPDSIEEVVGVIHIVLPVVGAVLIFMLAFIAVTMA